MQLTASGLDLSLIEHTGELVFGAGLVCDGVSEKRLSAMEHLFKTTKDCDLNALVYRAYRGICKTEDQVCFAEHGVRYDITVIFAGDAHGEFFKTSGHIHGMGKDMLVPYPELYEVLAGTVSFVLQKCPNLQADGSGTEQIEELRVVTAHAGQTVLIPPFWAHASINTGDDIAVFSNIAAVVCPLFYEPVQEHRGLAYRVMKTEQGITLKENPAWKLVPQAQMTEAHEAPNLGVRFGVPCYTQFMQNQKLYSYITQPDDYVSVLEVQSA